jgi:dTDP-glucose pyrophosphorylase
MDRAVVLAAGRGTRMRQPDDAVRLGPAQHAAADAGLKMLVPIHGHPFLAYVLHELADAGYRRVCLVVGPGDDDPVRAAARSLPTTRLRLDLAVQPEPLGNAHAVAAAAPLLGDDPFLVVNGDNLYPAADLARLRDLDGPGLLGYHRETLVRESNLPRERVAAFALLETRDGWLTGIVERPDAARLARSPDAPVSMTCWRFDRAVLDACRDVDPSPRGERELPDAVALAMARGSRFRVLPTRSGVLDLTGRRDIPSIEQRLAGREPRL